VQRGLPFDRQPAHGVRVQVSGGQAQLKEQEACSPDGRRASEPRKKLLRENRLHEEEQERADECRNLEWELSAHQ
jgi:hypothetical protein